MNEIATYGALALACFLAATLLPGGAEVAVVASLQNSMDPLYVVLVATVFNSLGSWLTFEMGRFGKLSWASRFLGIKESSVSKLKIKAEKYGSYLGFFCFLPFIGDPIALALGYFRSQRVAFLVFMSAGKLARFWIIWWGWSQV